MTSPIREGGGAFSKTPIRIYGCQTLCGLLTGGVLLFQKEDQEGLLVRGSVWGILESSFHRVKGYDSATIVTGDCIGAVTRISHIGSKGYTRRRLLH